jgi:hypothetical protein
VYSQSLSFRNRWKYLKKPDSGFFNFWLNGDQLGTAFSKGAIVPQELPVQKENTLTEEKVEPSSPFPGKPTSSCKQTCRFFAPAW